MIKYIFFIALLIGIIFDTVAQDNRVTWEYNYDHFGITNGLPSSETYQVYQDKSGLLWILTDRGIVRYDGFRFKTYTVENGLSDNVNFRVDEGPDGSVWFIGFNGLLSVYKDGKMQEYKYNSLLLKFFSIGQNAFNSFCITRDNSLIYSTHRSNVFSISDKGKVTELFSNDSKKESHGTVRFFEFDDRFVTCEYATLDSLVKIYLHQKGKSNFLGWLDTGYTTRMKKCKGQNFFLTNRMVFRVFKNRIITFGDQSEVIALDTDNEFVYVGYYKNGVKKYRFDPKTEKMVLVEHYLPQYSVSSVCKDKNGGLWITTLEKGVFEIRDEAFRQFSQAGASVDEETRFIDGNKEKVIITYYVGKWQQLHPPYRIKNYGKTLRWNNLVPYKNGFAFEGNIMDWSDWPEVNDHFEFSPFYASGSSITGIETGNYFHVYEIADGKRHVFDLQAIHKLKFASVYIWFYLVPNKKIYFVMQKGLFAFNIRNGRATGENKHVINRRITQLKYFDHWGLLAFSNAEGLFRINTENDHVSELAPQIKLGKQILAVFCDEKKRLWVATEKGIYLLAKKSGTITLEKFLNRDLLSSREVTGLYSYKDILYVATKFGVQKVDFLKVKKEASENPINLLFIRPFAKNKLLHLSKVYPAKTDLIKIVLSNSSLNRRNIYRYRFRKDQTWTKSDKSEITLSDPTNGKYNLEISYLNFSNKWSKPRIIASFEVEKIIFLRWYFIVFYVIAVLTLFYIILKLSISSVNKKNYMVNRMMELERMALAAQMNPHFIFNSLNSIHSFLLYEENENAEKYLLRFARLIRQTLSNSRLSYITVEEEYETLKNYILLEKMRFKNAFTFEIVCDLQTLPVNPCIPPMLIQPYVENAILHGLVKRSEGGKLSLKFLPDTGAVKVIIEDNGVGYAASRKKKRDSNHKSYGTQITEERLKSLKTNTNKEFTVSISNLDDSNAEFPGTRVILTIPIPNN